MWRRPGVRAAVAACGAACGLVVSRPSVSRAHSFDPLVSAADMDDLLRAAVRDEGYAARGFFASDEEATVALVDQVWAQYGVLTYASAQDLIAALGLREDDVFYDLGCGVGNVCAQVFLNAAPSAVKGIEYVPSRHAAACALLDVLKRRYPDRFVGERTLEFEQGNLLEYRELPATVVFMCSWCFDDALMQHVARCAVRGGRLRSLVSLRPLPDPTACGLESRGVVPVHCDFTPETLSAHLYGPATA
jgi:SAM-dependent methyltransferase